jgi:hypothetical protein
MTILPIDEINAMKDRLQVHFTENSDNVGEERIGKGRIKSREDAEDIIDELLDLFLLSYANGATATNSELGTAEMPSVEAVDAAVNKPVAGKTWRDRVMEYYESGGTLYDIVRIAETDVTRIYNQGAVDAVRANGAEDSVQKRWRTMEDDRVRDTHQYLEGMVVPFGSEFWTWDGDHAEYPGGFILPENNINCRCVVEVIRG